MNFMFVLGWRQFIPMLGSPTSVKCRDMTNHAKTAQRRKCAFRRTAKVSG
jgi:hypothetical protein